MQIITTSSYNDINIVNTENGTNTLLNNIKIIDTKTYDVTTNNNIQFVAINGVQGNGYLCVFDFKVKKDICSKIEFYKFADVYYLNDPITYIPANKNSNEDIFTIVFYKSKSTDSTYNKIDMRIEGRDRYNNFYNNINISGTLNIYVIE